MQNNHPQQSYTIKATADLLACSVATVYRLIRKGNLHTFHVGADQRVPASEIVRMQKGEAA